MQYSKLLDVVWMIASREAIAASWKEIQPGHILIGILKVSEVTQTDIMFQAEIDKATLQEIADEISSVQLFFKNENINTALLRRTLRSKIGNSNEVYNGGIMHRSERCKQLFAEAERSCSKQGKSTIDMIDLFKVLAASEMPEPVQKKSETAAPEGLNRLTIPFDSNARQFVAFPAGTGKPDHPAVISLTRRVIKQTKGILLLYSDLRFMYLSLSVISGRLRDQSNIHLNHVRPDLNLSEFEVLELLELYSNPEKTYLIFPAIEADQKMVFPVQGLNRFFEQTAVPSRIIMPVHASLQSWWYTQCPKSKLFLSPLLCDETSFHADVTIDKV